MPPSGKMHTSSPALSASRAVFDRSPRRLWAYGLIGIAAHDLGEAARPPVGDEVAVDRASAPAATTWRTAAGRRARRCDWARESRRLAPAYSRAGRRESCRRNASTSQARNLIVACGIKNDDVDEDRHRRQSAEQKDLLASENSASPSTGRRKQPIANGRDQHAAEREEIAGRQDRAAMLGRAAVLHERRQRHVEQTRS